MIAHDKSRQHLEQGRGAGRFRVERRKLPGEAVNSARQRELARHGDLDAITFGERLFPNIHREEESPLRQLSSISTRVCSML